MKIDGDTSALHWAAEHIGKPFAAGSDGPDAFYCWGLVRHCWRTRLGVELPLIEPANYGIRELVRTLATTPEFQAWRRTEQPAEMDVAVMGHAKHPHHVGLWVDANGGGILHAIEGAGVCFRTMPELRAEGWGFIELWSRSE